MLIGLVLLPLVLRCYCVKVYIHLPRNMLQIAKTVLIQWLATRLSTGNSSKSQLITGYKNLERTNTNQETLLSQIHQELPSIITR